MSTFEGQQIRLTFENFQKKGRESEKWNFNGNWKFFLGKLFLPFQIHPYFIQILFKPEFCSQ